ncbi:MAG: hypothetical protein V3T74_13935 [Gemmatimonadales bacterium]
MFLGTLLVVRHRSVRLVSMLAGIVLLLGMLGPGAGVAPTPHWLFLICGSLVAVAGARLLAPGAALTSARRVAGPWWLAPGGRLLGGLILLVPFLALGTVIAGAPGGDAAGALRLAGIALLYAAALGGLALALAPLLGATAAGSLGLVGAWLGGIGPSDVHTLLAGWGFVQRPAVLLWNTLPLAWRAERWYREGATDDLIVLAAWVPVAFALAAWAVGSTGRRSTPEEVA